jgi:hypothetical protein
METAANGLEKLLQSFFANTVECVYDVFLDRGFERASAPRQSINVFFSL